MKKSIFLGLLALTVSTMAKGGPFSGDADVAVGYGYDSNVSIDEVDLNTNIGDKFSDVRLSGGLDYQSDDELKLSARMTLSNKYYNTFDQFDNALILSSVAAKKKWGKWELGFTARYIDFKLDGDGFQELTQLSPTLSWFINKKSYLRIALETTDESYDDRKTRDNDRDEVSLSYYYFLNGLRHYITLHAEIANEDAKSRVFSNDAWQVRLVYQKRLNKILKDSTLKLSYRYQERDYDDQQNPGIGDFREDNRHRYEIELEVPVNSHWSIAAELVYSDYRSNLGSADYTQNVAQLTVKYEF